MRHACTAALLFIPAAVALTWWNIDFLLSNHPSFNNLYVDRESFSAVSLLSGFLIAMVPAGILMWGIAKSASLVRALFGGGEIFSLKTMLRVRRFAWSTLLFGITHLVTIPILSVILTLNNPPGQKALSISISFERPFFSFSYPVSSLRSPGSWVRGAK